MSVIVGFFNPNGGVVPLEKLERMMKPVSHWGPDGKGIWTDGPVGLGQLMLYNTPEAKYERFPMISACGNYVLVANARIDNREELLKRFDLPVSPSPVIPDGTLILEAYKKWGEDCPNHLLGDWSFALWDIKNRKFFIARDHHGNTSFYYFRCGQFFCFSTSQKSLLALDEVPRRPNPMTIAKVLVAWNDQVDETAYEGILRLPPAHCIRLTSDYFRVKRYWFLEEAPAIRLKSDSAYVEQFLDLYREAVRCRLRSPRRVGIWLSGGLDSSSVAALAARELKKQNQPLYSFSSVPFFPVPQEFKGRFFDEKPYVEETVKLVGNISPHYINAENINPITLLEKAVDFYEQPMHSAVNQYWILTLMEAAKQQSVGTMLTGQGGNAGISWHGRNLFLSLALKGNLPDLIKELRQWSRVRNRSLLSAFKSLVLGPMVRHIKGRVNRFVPLKKPWSAYSVINPAFEKRLDLQKVMSRKGHDPFFAMKLDSKRARFDSMKPGRSIGGFFSFELGAEYTMENRDPTIDKRILEFCLGIPDRQFFSKGTDRFLIRRAMDGLLPPKVLMNFRKGVQAADLNVRLIKILPEIQRILEKIEASELASFYLDVPQMFRWFRQLEQHHNPLEPYRWSSPLMTGIGVGLFLVRFS